MAVTVKLNNSNESTYPDADFISIEDGHLHVRGSKQGTSGYRTIALYIPGYWVSAVVEDDAK
jgi:outer membrane receptor for monomeric catechols